MKCEISTWGPELISVRFQEEKHFQQRLGHKLEFDDLIGGSKGKMLRSPVSSAVQGPSEYWVSDVKK